MTTAAIEKKVRGWRLFAWLLLLATGNSGVSVPAYGQALPLDEYSVKAALLFNIAKYTDWPAKSFSQSSDPIIIGVLGEDPFGAVLDQLVNGRKVRGRSIVIRRANGIAELEGAHVVFVSASQPEAPQDCAALERARTLTVGDTEFSAPYTAVSMEVDRGKVAFSVDLARTHPTGAVLSSHLLKFAKTVKPADGIVAR